MTYLIGTDVDLYNDNDETVRQIDFSIMSQNAKFTIVRAGQNIWKDPDFLYNWSMSKRANLPRGSYWLYDDRIDLKTQAELYMSVFDGDFGELPMFIDVEKDYGGQFKGWENWKIFLEHLKILVGNKEIGIYTNFYYWKDNVPSSENIYFNQYPLWIASYNPQPAIRDTWKDKGWLFWQYTDKGIGSLYGVESSSVDLNYYNGDEISLIKRFNIQININPIPTEDLLLEEKQYYDGINYKKYETYTSYGKATYHLMKVDSDKIELYVSPQLQARKYVPDYLDAFNIDFAINGDGFISTTIAGYASSEGNVYGKFGIEEPVYIGKNNELSLVRPSSIWNAISHPNRLVINGIIVPINKAIDDIRARTAWGYSEDGKTIFFFVVDGGDYYSKEGLNFQDVAKIMLKLGCYMAYMNDGGGSTTMAIRDNGIVKIIGKPSGEDDVIRYPGYKLRRVANILGFTIKNKTTIPPGTIPNNNIKKITVEYSDNKYITTNISKR